MSSSNCCFLTCIQASQEAGQLVWYPISQFVVTYTIRGFSVVSEGEVDVFPGIPFLSLWSCGCWQFDLWFLCLFSIQLVHLEILGSHTVETYLEDFEDYIANMCNECNCEVIWAFFGIGMKTDIFQSCGHCWLFHFFWDIECNPLTVSSFRIWNNSAGILSSPLSLF